MSALTIFLGSFISFALEPMIGRALLPVFGGAPTVWVTCLAAFQLLMVAGYGYAGFVGNGTSQRRTWLHLVLLALAAGWCGVVAFTKGMILSALASATGIPALDVFICVLAIAALAFVLLSANATLVQSVSGGNYRLYAVSNLGSLLGLFCYPTLVEPFASLTMQWLLLAAAIAVYAVFLAVLVKGAKGVQDVRPETKDASPSALRTPHSALLYLLIPAVSAALLNATTSHLSLDVAPLPLLWALLLGLFLLSYIVGFSGWSRPIYWVFPAVVSSVCSLTMFFGYIDSDFWELLVCHSLALFFITTFLHSWLYAIRPQTSKLSRYYLLNVVGGALGGLFTSMLAPVLFNSVFEFPLMLFVSVAAFLAWAVLSGGWIVRCTVVLLLVGTCGLRLSDAAAHRRMFAPTQIIHSDRGFFGTLRVIEGHRHNMDGTTTTTHGFYHGNIVHGIQVRNDGLERMPTAYYTPYACGHAIIGHPAYTGHRNPRPMRVCLVGMGMGVCFAYARTNDYYRAYEISPEVAAVACDKRLFSFVDTCLGTPDVRVVDARKGLEQERAANEEKYDVILVDAFSGDNIPYHLSTHEAVQLYLDRLKPDGLLCYHFSNKYLDLKPYVKGIADEFNLRSLAYASEDDRPRYGIYAEVIVYMREGATIDELPLDSGLCSAMNLSSIKPLTPLPTDDKGSFLSLIRFNGEN